MARKRYPIGIQSFNEIRTKNYLYIDKTEYIYNMVHSDPKYFFLSRPRRFGKSLLVATIQAYFEGRKELFKDLAIEKLEKEWVERPVVKLSLASVKSFDVDVLQRNLHYILEENEARLGVENGGPDINTRLKKLISNAYLKTGKQVALLIDEYDAPLLDALHDEDRLKKVREIMRSFYSPIKDLDDMLCFGFITGITKFSQVSIFSELNNLSNISMLPEYAGICGITEEEMLANMQEGILELGNTLEFTEEEAVAALKENYDGYHFTWPSPDVYNPFSLLNALSDKQLDPYWFSSGTPVFVIEMLRKFNIPPLMLSSPRKAMKEDFDAPAERMISITPLLYQSGYTTIKSRNKLGTYSLDLPNREIRIGLIKSLMHNYLGSETENCKVMVSEMMEALLNQDMNLFFKNLQDFLGTVPKANFMEKTPERFEAYWQNVLFIIFSLLGAYCHVEVKTPKGWIDVVAQTADALYLIELKMEKSAETAMHQIDLKEYDSRFTTCNLPVVKIGASFSEKKRNLTGWKVV